MGVATVLLDVVGRGVFNLCVYAGEIWRWRICGDTCQAFRGPDDNMPSDVIMFPGIASLLTSCTWLIKVVAYLGDGLDIDRSPV